MQRHEKDSKMRNKIQVPSLRPRPAYFETTLKYSYFLNSIFNFELNHVVLMDKHTDTRTDGRRGGRRDRETDGRPSEQSLLHIEMRGRIKQGRIHDQQMRLPLGRGSIGSERLAFSGLSQYSDHF